MSKVQIRGWCNYYRTVCSKETFDTEDHILWNMLRAWTVSRKKNRTPLIEALRKYFSYGRRGKWTFQTNGMVLYYHAETEIKRHQLVRAEVSPYDGNWTYWSKRRGIYLNFPPRKTTKALSKGSCSDFCTTHYWVQSL